MLNLFQKIDNWVDSRHIFSLFSFSTTISAALLARQKCKDRTKLIDKLYLLMDNSEILKQINSIQREGYLQKQSRFLKSWRKRWIVLTANLMLTYKQQRVYQNPTEIIFLKEVISIKTCDEEVDKKCAFKIETNETTFFFCCETPLEKEQWIGAIGKAMVKRSNRDIDD